MNMNKETFLNFEEARSSGKFNMIMDAKQVMSIYGISKEDYIYIITNYPSLAKKYL